jgi:site-specific recombinase XerD
LAAGVVGKVTPHALRHAFAAHLVEAGVDIRVLQIALGHRNIRTTARYAHVPESLLTRMSSPMEWLRD